MPISDVLKKPAPLDQAVDKLIEMHQKHMASKPYGNVMYKAAALAKVNPAVLDDLVKNQVTPRLFRDNRGPELLAGLRQRLGTEKQAKSTNPKKVQTLTALVRYAETALRSAPQQKTLDDAVLQERYYTPPPKQVVRRLATKATVKQDPRLLTDEQVHNVRINECQVTLKEALEFREGVGLRHMSAPDIEGARKALLQNLDDAELFLLAVGGQKNLLKQIQALKNDLGPLGQARLFTPAQVLEGKLQECRLAIQEALDFVSGNGLHGMSAVDRKEIRDTVLQDLDAAALYLQEIDGPKDLLKHVAALQRQIDRLGQG